MKHRRSILSIAMATLVLLAGVAVYASTSVGAAPAATSTVGSPIAPGTTVAVCNQPGSATSYLFVQGKDNALWGATWSSAAPLVQPTWVSLGGILTASPAAAWTSVGPVVYVRAANEHDGQPYQYILLTSTWTRVPNYGKMMAGTAAGVSAWPGRVDLFVDGTNGALYQITQTAGGWTNWARGSPIGALSSGPAAASRSAGNIDVFAPMLDSSIHWWSYQNGLWVQNNAPLGHTVAAGTQPGAAGTGALVVIVWKDAGSGLVFRQVGAPAANAWGAGAANVATVPGTITSPAITINAAGAYAWISAATLPAGNGHIYWALPGSVVWSGNFNGPTPV